MTCYISRGNIITSLNGVHLDSPAKMLNVRRSQPVGSTVRLQASRAGLARRGRAA